GLGAATPPRAAFGAVLKKQARSRPDVQQPPAAAAVEQPLEGVEALRVDQIEPLAILEVTLDVERFLRRVVLVAVDVLEFRRRRDRNDVLEPAGITFDDRESLCGVEAPAALVLPP